MHQRRLESIQQFGGKPLDDDLRVDLTIYNIPASLLKQFSQNVVQLYYPGGVSDAIKDLIRKAVIEKQPIVAQTT
jgi:hypothetical protein